VNRAVVVSFVVLAGCARGASLGGNGDAPGGYQDAPGYMDAPTRMAAADAPASMQDDAKLPPDAKVYEDAKVFEDSKVFLDGKIYEDAHVYMDACTPMQMQVLTNPAFDLSPVETGWTQTENPNKSIEIVTDETPPDGFAYQSPSYYAWLGAEVGPNHSTPYVDDLQQNVTIPANTTSLTLTGNYIVFTNEDQDDPSVYDTAVVELTQTDGTPISPSLQLNNTDDQNDHSSHNPPPWQTFSLTFDAAALSGTTVTVNMTSSNDYSNYTSFAFDTLALTATYCP
jgi:hypothetical protein